MTERAVETLLTWPDGAHRGWSGGKSYTVVKSSLAGGRSVKLEARELGGSDYISMNLYLLNDSPRIFPCEMPLEKVVAFLEHLSADAPSEVTPGS